VGFVLHVHENLAAVIEHVAGKNLFFFCHRAPRFIKVWVTVMVS
jgi:hypothetical protein